MRGLAALAGILIAGAVAAQDPASAPAPGDAARAAAERLSRAGRMLDEAKGARNRVKALSETVHAYEDGLEAMREGLRRAAIREETLTRALQSREDDVARLLGVLMAMGDTPAPVLLLHPSGPVGTARSGMILTEVTPALNARATELRERLNEVAILRGLQETAADTLAKGLQGAQKARTTLSQAVADRTDLPRRFTEDPVKTALLIASTETLEGFASGLSEIAVDEAPGSLPGIADRKGHLPLPVQGRILRRAGEQDAAGIARPGIVMATRPRALVTTPAPATVRYRGPLLDYGNVIILEPQAGILLVLAGLDVVYGDTGQVLPGGSPVGLMGGTAPDADLISSASLQETGAEHSETLYIEVRENNSPVDPAQWFKTDEG
ncbi:peptidase M23 [Roseovarius sp. A21]|uniref:Peptidase M23 n=1 Tax=Roseovarius bejariae TaxID=2576383 RepID=A0A844CN79_9RHOB|nr:peptidoglycan DD-metalloendopeptidase family protein [Roseovarius bejariae]MRU14925.1 peptidase M23 [Roseovarius bejariae]